MNNLLVDLDAGRFGAKGLTAATKAIERAGFTICHPERSAKRVVEGPVERSRDLSFEQFLAWIDEEFGGTWSSEAFAGKNIVVRRGDRFAGFVTYNPRGLSFRWLRGLAKEEDVGVFGPFGVAPEFRGSPLGSNLLKLALATLRREGYKRALIAAVGHPTLVAYYERHAGARVAEAFDLFPSRSHRYKTIVLASGNGTNFQSVIDAVAGGKLPLDLHALVSNNADAYAITRARIAKIHSIILPWNRKSQSRADYDAALLEAVEREEPELLLLLGWMHLLEDRFVERFPHAINIHPAFLPLDQTLDEVTFPDGSLMPAFRGSHAVRDALQWGSRWIGATAHRVSAETDRGAVLVRKPLAVIAGDTEDKALARLHPLEHRVLSAAILRWVYEQQ